LNRSILNVTLLSVALALGACATKHPMAAAGTEFSKIRRVSVVPFEGTGGREVTDEFVRRLVLTGLEVTDARHPGDAILGGSVTDYKANRTLMVFLGKTTVIAPGGQPFVMNNPILAPGASQGAPESLVAGAQNAQVASVGAEVSVTASLTDASNGRLLWSGRYAYEGFDMDGALQPVVASLIRSLSSVVPQMNRRPG
jgi:TolB-like protein